MEGKKGQELKELVRTKIEPINACLREFHLWLFTRHGTNTESRPWGVFRYSQGRDQPKEFVSTSERGYRGAVDPDQITLVRFWMRTRTVLMSNHPDNSDSPISVVKKTSPELQKKEAVLFNGFLNVNRYNGINLLCHRKIWTKVRAAFGRSGYPMTPPLYCFPVWPPVLFNRLGLVWDLAKDSSGRGATVREELRE